MYELLAKAFAILGIPKPKLTHQLIIGLALISLLPFIWHNANNLVIVIATIILAPTGSTFIALGIWRKENKLPDSLGGV